MTSNKEEEAFVFLVDSQRECKRKGCGWGGSGVTAGILGNQKLRTEYQTKRNSFLLFNLITKVQTAIKDDCLL